jgi:Zn-finger nucleic acid-binding protein
MNCPVCNVALTMTDRQGVEIDYCPKCRGVWLDRGELDKIIERSATAQQQHSGGGYENRDPRYERDRHYDREQEHYYKKKKKRESFLGELFDF